MKIKTSELVGDALDWAVAQCEGWTNTRCGAGCDCLQHRNPEGRASILPQYSTHWALGGTIIDREINNLFQHNLLDKSSPPMWCAVIHIPGKNGTRLLQMDGPTPLIAAMRCFVALKLGEEIEIPKELLP